MSTKQTAIVALAFSHLLAAGNPAFAQSASSSAPTDPFDALFYQALEDYDDGEYVDALAKFRSVYEAKPSQSVLYNIAKVHVKLNQPLEAVECLDKLLNTGCTIEEEELCEKARGQLKEQKAFIARLTVITNLPGADVVVDGNVMGKTPLAKPLRLLKARHSVELRRPGYSGKPQDVDLEDGDASVKLEAQEDEASIAANGGFLALNFTEDHAVIWVNGALRGEYRTRLRLAPGPHQIRAERGGFITVEREVEVIAGGTTTETIRFQPTPETLVKVAEAYERQKRWGTGLTAVGGVAVVAGVVALLLTSSQMNYTCDKRADTGVTDDINACTNAQSRYRYSWIPMAAGVAFLAPGVGLLIFRADPHRYNANPSQPNNISRLTLMPTITPEVAGLSVRLMGVF